jgi:L-ascorbate metabolism protein UlaG (beta-lactamase superfamily)
MACASWRPFDGFYAEAAHAPRGPDGFRNNYPHDPPASFWLWQWERWRGGMPEPPPGGWNIPAMRCDVGRLRNPAHEPLATWIGHASFLVQLGGVNVLVDPQFAPRASPLAVAGPRRVVPLPIDPRELPRVDVVLTSHNHYDHLDTATVRQLARQPGGPPLYLAPLGLAAWFRAKGIASVDELDWWDTREFGGLAFTLVPVQHWSRRGLADFNRTLWGGWSIEGAGLKVLHTGDLGYSKDARDIGERLGPFDLAFIPIGAYAPRWFMKVMHVDVPEAVRVRSDLRAARALGMHWGTFEHLTDEPLDEPPRLLGRERDAAGLAVRDFDVMKIGETRRIERARDTPA